MRGTPCRTRGVDFRFYLGLGEWRKREGRKLIRRFKQVRHPEAPYLCPQ